MANFTPSRKTAQDFNNGVEYIDGIGNKTGDALHAETINGVIESQLWTQGFAANQPDVSEANQVGTVSVSIVTDSDGTAQLKFSNLKGTQGVGISSILPNGTDSAGGNIYKITLDDGRTYNFTAPKGDTGSGGGAVNSVNGQTGAVTITASGIGAYTKPSSGIPESDLSQSAQTKLSNSTSVLANPSMSGSEGNLASIKIGDIKYKIVHPVSSVNGKTGAVTISKSDVGLSNVDNVKQYSSSNPPPYPVTSVNGKTGAVTIETGGENNFDRARYYCTTAADANAATKGCFLINKNGELDVAEGFQLKNGDKISVYFEKGSRVNPFSLNINGTITLSVLNVTASRGLIIYPGDTIDFIYRKNGDEGFLIAQSPLKAITNTPGLTYPLRINNTLNTSTGGNKSFYAPTTAGTAGQVLVSSGGTSAPVWQDQSGGGGTSFGGYRVYNSADSGNSGGAAANLFFINSSGKFEKTDVSFSSYGTDIENVVYLVFTNLGSGSQIAYVFTLMDMTNGSIKTYSAYGSLSSAGVTTGKVYMLLSDFVFYD